MSARTHAAPAYGNPAHWAADLPAAAGTARHSPERITAATEEAFHLRFLAQCAAPDARMRTVDNTVHLVDVTTGSAATPTPADGRWRVRESGPVRLWQRIETDRTAYDDARRPGPATFARRHALHPRTPRLPLPRP
ncbi:hypothetical protein [Streptomyces cinereospinus]|uniref:Uncharacterized protein n=1 Tax=Streptomyces cinereospinus TaxID=285561 RepID=A0ABV5MXQ1_9ACTN